MPPLKEKLAGVHVQLNEAIKREEHKTWLSKHEVPAHAAALERAHEVAKSWSTTADRRWRDDSGRRYETDWYPDPTRSTQERTVSFRLTSKTDKRGAPDDASIRVRIVDYGDVSVAPIEERWVRLGVTVTYTHQGTSMRARGATYEMDPERSAPPAVPIDGLTEINEVIQFVDDAAAQALGGGGRPIQAPSAE